MGIDQDNLTTEAAKFAGEQEDLSNRQGILNQILNPKNPIAKENYNQETYAAGS